MGKKKIKRQSAKEILADVDREMAKPRMAMSARVDSQSVEGKSYNTNLLPLNVNNWLVEAHRREFYGV